MSDSDGDTTFGWDASHYDAPPTSRDGIDFYVHKACEGHRYYTDNEYGASLNAARKLGIPVLGAYFVPHGGTTADQVAFLVEVLDKETPWWRTYPAWMLQIDAEKFEYMDRAPTIAEVNAFADEYVRRTGRPASSVFAYAPKWLYGDKVSGLRYAVWASAYGSNPAGHYPDVYPGNGSSRWAAYGGKTPTILQYGSRTTIAGQTTCDANAFRGTLAELAALVTGDDMNWDDKIGGTANKDRTFRQVLQDLSNERDWRHEPAGTATLNPPAPTSRAVRAAEASDKTLTQEPVQAAPIDQAVVDAAVEKALTNPATLAALAKAINDDAAARMAS
jgi:hypothetical protein